MTKEKKRNEMKVSENKKKSQNLSRQKKRFNPPKIKIKVTAHLEMIKKAIQKLCTRVLKGALSEWN